MAKPSQADENSDARRAGHGGHHSSSRPREGVVMAETGARRIRRSAAPAAPEWPQADRGAVRHPASRAAGPDLPAPSGRIAIGAPAAIARAAPRTSGREVRGSARRSLPAAARCSRFRSRPPRRVLPSPCRGSQPVDLDLADDGHDGHRQQHPQRGPQLTGQHRQGMHPMRAHRVRAHHLQPPCRFVPRQALRSAAQPGQDIIGWLRGALVTGDGQRRLPPGQP